MKKIIIALLIIAAITGAAYMLFFKKDAAPTFRTDKVVKGDIRASITATGTVNAVTTVLVGTQVSGTIKALFADFNSKVTKGQVIAQIDPTIFQAQVDQASANHLASKANYDKAKASLKDAERTLARSRELFKKNLIAKSDLDTAETNRDTADAQVSAAKAQIAQAEAALKAAETNLAYTRIVSPVDGTVVSRNVDVGQTVAASFQTPTLFNIAQDLKKMQTDSNVAEADIGKVTVGLNVEFNVDAYPETTFKGTVSEIRNAPLIVQNVVTYDVVIKVDNEDMKLKPGMTTNITIIYASKKGALKIPNAALRFVPPSSNDKNESKERPTGPGVWILQDNRPVRIKITAGINDGTFTELAAGSLTEGQELIVETLDKGKGRPTGPRMF